MRIPEKLIVGLLATCAALTILITFGVLYTLAVEAVRFFSEVSIVDFLTDTQWTPLFTEKHFGILPLLSGTILTSFIAVAIALPIGLTIAVYMNEYAPASFAFWKMRVRTRGVTTERAIFQRPPSSTIVLA